MLAPAAQSEQMGQTMKYAGRTFRQISVHLAVIFRHISR